jgi:hypothetical protein
MAPPSSTDPEKQRRVRKLIDVWLAPERIEAAGLFDVDRVRTFIEDAWSSGEHARGARNDIIVNHLLGMQLLDAVRERPQDPPRAAG